MPDFRIHPSVAQRSDIDFQRRPDPVLRRRRGLMALAGLVSFAPLVYAILSGDETIYWSRPCSASHRLIQNDCRHCHIERFQGLMMMTEGTQYVRSLETRTCRVCHTAREATDHSPQMVSSEITSCFHCHREHQGRETLARVDDGHCTVCHGDLQSSDGPPSFMASIGSFDEHPEFAVRRSAGDDAARPGEQHKALRLADLTVNDGQWTWTDRAKLHFNHRLHLAADGIAAPAADGGPPRTVSLQCADCHQLAADGRYMQPIEYDRHCRDCHPLHYGEELFRFDAKLDLGGPLPHEHPRIVRDAIRSRLMAWATAHPERIAPADAEPPRLPHKTPPPTLAARDKWEWVDRRLAEVEQVVFGKASDVRFPKFMQACTFCHVVEKDPSGAADGSGVPLEWTIAKPGIPERWLPHSRFRHDRHNSLELHGRRLDCAHCHYVTPPERVLATIRGGAGGDAAGSPDPARRPGSVFESTLTSDVLMPSIETCRDCHGGSGRRTISGAARNDCVECHGYHHDATNIK
ncbi:MAG TPA: hypothetical protein VML55_23685 [Planctomycetaceae bacterium]|nr:hypothetical protein [Planctomycetaceae bacterium]